MEPVLDEITVTPCSDWQPAERIRVLSELLKSLDRRGAARVLRSVRDVADRDFGGGRGLRSWCFDRSVDQVAGRLIASRLSIQPHVDGPNGIFAQAEGERVLEPRLNNILALGAGVAALNDSFLVGVGSAENSRGEVIDVEIVDASSEELNSSSITVFRYIQPDEVDANDQAIRLRVDQTLSNGVQLLARLNEIYPDIRLGVRAIESIRSLNGTEPVFQQVVRHLRALNNAVSNWLVGTSFVPEGITYSSESTQTLGHRRYGALRQFPCPEGFEHEQWSLHTKMTGGAGARMYYRPVWDLTNKVVLIGYIGAHLPCVLYPT